MIVKLHNIKKHRDRSTNKLRSNQNTTINIPSEYDNSSYEEIKEYIQSMYEISKKSKIKIYRRYNEDDIEVKEGQHVIYKGETTKNFIKNKTYEIRGIITGYIQLLGELDIRSFFYFSENKYQSEFYKNFYTYTQQEMRSKKLERILK